jgi:hypothetical protein
VDAPGYERRRGDVAAPTDSVVVLHPATTNDGVTPGAVARCDDEPAWVGDPGVTSDTTGGTRRFVRATALEDSGYTSANASIGDVNGDGHPDIVLVKGRHWPLRNLVRLGDGRGGFAPAYAVEDAPDRSYSGVLADLDRDGDLDIVVSNDDPDAKHVLLNDGRGRFTRGASFGEATWSTREVAVADLTGDGLVDVVLANRGGRGTVPSYLCEGLGDGRFAAPCRVVSAGSATSITPVDINGDGALDLLVPHRDGGQGVALINDGAGGFGERRPFGLPAQRIRAARAADFDGDGVPDLAVIDQRDGPAVLRGRRDGTWAEPVPLGAAGMQPYAILVHDLDGNGRPDILVGYVEARPVAYFNDGPGRFTPVPFGDDAGATYGFAVGDLDGDGLLDVVIARSDAPNVLFFGERAVAVER